jgi:hypothetical protein
MKFRALAGLSLALVLSSMQLHASEDVNEADVTEALAAEEAHFAAMTEEQAAQAVRDEAEAIEQHLDEAVQAGELAPEQAQVVREQTATAVAATQSKGFKKKLVAGLKKIRRGIGYGSQAVSLALAAPAWIGSGFTLGVISGQRLPDQRGVRAGVVATHLGAGAVTEITAISYANNIPFFGAVAPITASIAVINTVFICRNFSGVDADDTPYCQRIGAINRALTTTAYSKSRTGGTRFRKFLGKVFRFGRRADPQPPVQPQPPVEDPVVRP